MAHTAKLALVLRVGLDAQTSRQDELPDRGAETGEEGVEWLSQNKITCQQQHLRYPKEQPLRTRVRFRCFPELRSTRPTSPHHNKHHNKHHTKTPTLT